jgi:hypothetical protein
MERSGRAGGSEPGGGENAHKLFKWFEWLTNNELDVHFLDIDEIRGERGKVVGVIPLP